MSSTNPSPNLNFSHSACRLRRVKKIQFGVWSPDLIKQGSVTQKATINGQEIRAGITKYDRYQNGRPVYGGVNDPRMGTFDYTGRCKTCDCAYTGSASKVHDCPGHFGHIELSRPVYHVGFIDEVLKILRCVCYHCSRVLVDKSNYKFKNILNIRDPETRLRALHNVCRACKKCETGGRDDVRSELLSLMEISDENAASAPEQSAGCGGLLPSYSRSGLEVKIDFPGDMPDIPGTGDRKQKLPAHKAFDILKNISDADAKILGFDIAWARPEWLLVSVLPVPPPHVRPSVEAAGTAASEDDLTHLLTTIVKDNMTLEHLILKGEPPHIIAQFEQLLQFRVTAYFDNERADMPRETQRSGRPLKTIKQRLKGKEGRLRGNLMGKRVDFSARTVITADPNLSIDQVGVPRSIALRLSVPVPVTPFNIGMLREMVARGPLEWPGAVSIIRGDGTRIDLRYVRSKNDTVLEYGWVVERHLKDDDIVLFNRQPSLHKMSIMGHRAKILDWSTFRLNLSVTTPYNADFDGDEMNLHVPQSITARADADNLMMVPRNIITPQNNRNVMGIVQDSLLGVTRMTKRDVFIEKDVFMNAMMWISTWDGKMPSPAIIKPRPLWTGKQLFSMICPKINYRGISKNHPSGANPFNLYDSEVLIHSGELLQGIVDKNIVGTSGGSIVHVCWLQDGWEETRRFMNQVQTTTNYWLVNTSFSVGISDTVADSATMKAIQETLDEAKSKVKNIMERGQDGSLKGQPGKTLMESFEVHVNEVLNDARSTVGKSAQNSLKERNAIKGTVMAGSKGSFLNISQIIACVGQQNVQGARIKYGFKQRTLPHFSKDDLGMESRGFVENSYLRGLSPTEFFFHAMGGREGLIDTAVKTSETGYIQRRLVKAMESVMARYDTTLRNSRGCVMQFLYGEDGMDAQRIERQKFDAYTYKESDYQEKYYMDVHSENFGKLDQKNSFNENLLYLHKDIINNCRNDLDIGLILDEEYDQLCRDRVELREILACRGSGSETDPNVYLPVNIDRLIWNAQRDFRVNYKEPTKLHPKKVVELVRKLCREDLIVVRGEDPLSREAQNNATLLFQMLLRSKLASKRVLKEYRLNEPALEWLRGQIISEFYAAIVHPGEMCGVMAAQSLGEPATQMTLNTFHNTGISAKNVTLGVPRLNEILNVSKQVRTPSLTIYLKQEYAYDVEEANMLQIRLEYTTLGDITVKTEIHYDPNTRGTTIQEDSEFVDEYFLMPDDDVDPDKMSPWVLRIELNRELFFVKGLAMEEIASLIMGYFGNGVHVIHTDDNDERLVLRIRIIITEEDKLAESEEVATGSEDQNFLRQMQKELLEKLHLRGVPGIKKVYLSEKKLPRWDDRTGFEEQRKEWMMETDGSNLAEVLSFPTVDHTRTTSNDVVEMFQVLGVEGVRASLFNELRAVISFDGSYVNYRHIACLTDCMTFGGYIMAVSRHGINRSEAGPMLRASFEETVEVLMTAAMYSQHDYLDGVTENIMMGQLARVGTGVVDLLLDSSKLQNAVEYDIASRIGQSLDQSSLEPFGTPQATPIATTPNSLLSSSYAPTPLIAAFSPSNTPQYGSSVYYSPGNRMLSPSSPSYNPASPAYGLGGYGLKSDSYRMSGGGPGTPGFSPNSPYLSTSPAYSPLSAVNSPTSPAYSPTINSVSPASPSYSPKSPIFSPTTPVYSPTNQAYSPTTPVYSPTTPVYSPTTPVYSPTTPAYSPTTASMSPTISDAMSLPSSLGSSPAYSPTAPDYSPTTPVYSPTGATNISPTSPEYSPPPNDDIVAFAATTTTATITSFRSSVNQYDDSTMDLDETEAITASNDVYGNTQYYEEEQETQYIQEEVEEQEDGNEGGEQDYGDDV